MANDKTRLAARFAAGVLIGFFAMLMAAHLSMPRPLFDEPLSSVALDQDGRLLSARIARDGQWRFAAPDSVPHKFERCLLTFEDRRFRHHWGVDPAAIVRAGVRNIEAGRVREGGSTLTMQVARMACGRKRRTWAQKAIETLWAIDIEFSHSKDEILRLYAANAPFGGNVVGLEAAAWRYFGREASELTWAESALLAVLPNAPAKIHMARNRGPLLKKRDRLLDALHSQGDISATELELAKAEPLPDKPFAIENRAPQMVSRLYATRPEGGTTRTTIDATLQRQAQAIADSYRARYAANHIYDIGILVAEVTTGHIKAYVGNASQPSATCMVDMVSAERSTGSILKPILYAAMLSAGEITPKMLMADTPLDINGFTPQNYSHTYSGAVAADEALTRSLNVPLVRMLAAHNVGRFMADLRQMGMTTLHYSDDHYGASLILGGAEATLTDVCGMYASMARRLGEYNGQRTHTPLAPTQATFALSPTPTRPKESKSQVAATPLTPAAIWHTLRAMTELSRPEEEADWQSFASMGTVAWKTGTSYGNRDAWAVGVTRSHVVGVWVGNATGEGRASMTGVGFAAPPMFDVFSIVGRHETRGWFEEPVEDEEPMTVCRRSGMRSGDACAEVDTILLPRQSAGTPVCAYCRLAHVTKDGAWQVNSSCENTAGMVTRSWFVLPPAMEYYYRKTHTDYAPLPPVRPDCENAAAKRLEIIYPQRGQRVVRTRSFDGTLQGMVCQAAAPASGRVFWHLDGKYLGETEGKHEMAIEPEMGAHSLVVVDENGERAEVTFGVE